MQSWPPTYKEDLVDQILFSIGFCNKTKDKFF